MLKTKNILQFIICFGCERLLLTYAEMDVYVNTALTGVRIDSEIFHGFRKPPQFQGEPPRLKDEPLRPQGEPELLQGDHTRLQEPAGYRVSLLAPG
jgi:hypothetical protein